MLTCSTLPLSARLPAGKSRSDKIKICIAIYIKKDSTENNEFKTNLASG